MKFFCWNIKDGGVLNFSTPIVSNIQNILATIEKEGPDVVIIQEYLSEYSEELITNGLSKLSYSHTVCDDHPERTLRKRVLIASKIPFQNVDTTANISDYNKRNWREIIVNKSIHILGVHVPLAETTNINGRTIDNRNEKKRFLDAMEAKFAEYKNCPEPCIICGDFNLHENAVYKEYLDIFSRNLTEVTTAAPTWGKHKFDYIYANEAFRKLIDAGAEFHPQKTRFSDHSYLCVEALTEAAIA